MKCANIEFMELSKEILSKGGCLRFRAHGGSMRPFIKDGQVIQVSPIKAPEIKPGDVILYRSLKNRMVVHRVIKKCTKSAKTAFLTKGDCLPGFDEYAHPERILGKVVAIEKNNKTIRMDRGLLGLTNILYAKLSPFSKWIYPPLRKIRHKIIRVKNRYADRKPVSALSGKTKY